MLLHEYVVVVVVVAAVVVAVAAALVVVVAAVAVAVAVETVHRRHRLPGVRRGGCIYKSEMGPIGSLRLTWGVFPGEHARRKTETPGTAKTATTAEAAEPAATCRSSSMPEPPVTRCFEHPWRHCTGGRRPRAPPGVFFF